MGTDPPAPGCVKSTSVVHVVDAASTFDENVTRTVIATSSKTTVALSARNGFDIDPAPEPSHPLGGLRERDKGDPSNSFWFNLPLGGGRVAEPVDEGPGRGADA